MALMGTMALIAYAGMAFYLGWFLRGDHEAVKREEAKHRGRAVRK